MKYNPSDNSLSDDKIIKLDAFGIVVTLTGDEGGSITSTLKEGHAEYDSVIDGIESMILAHAIAGIDVNSPSYLEGIETAVIGAANNIEDDKEHQSISLTDFSSSDSDSISEMIQEQLDDMGIEYSSFSYSVDVDVLVD